MNTIRDAILLGTRGAAELHDALRMRQQVEDLNGAVDVFGVIAGLSVPLLFRPLDKLLGACIRLEDAAGIVVTTQRDLHMQRFTAAHELGHFVLEHEGSLDREIRLPGESTDRDLREIAADAFAAEFLMPRWLYGYHAKRHGWTRALLKDPTNVYQLSLRMAVSYSAACWGLLAHRILDSATVDRLRRVTPKQIKQETLRNIRLDDPWADVWLLDMRDNNAAILAGPGDLFVLNLVEHSGSGFLWEARDIGGVGFAVLEDGCEPELGSAIGGPTVRRMVLRAVTSGMHELELAELRPWEKRARPINSVSIAISTLGAEVAGLPRQSRQLQLPPVLH